MNKSSYRINGMLAYILAIAANLVVQIFAAIVASIALGNGLNLSENIAFNLFAMLFIQIAFFAVYYMQIYKRKDVLEARVLNNINTTRFYLAPLIAFLCIFAFYSPTLWFALILDKMGYSGSAIPVMSTPFEFFLGAVVMVFAAPICEELIFRGALLSSLRRNTSETKAILLSSFAFMLMHMSPSQTVYQFLLGIVLAVCTIKTGSLLLPMLIHALSNTFALVIDYTPLGVKIENLIEYFIANLPAIGLLISMGVALFFGFALYLTLQYLKKNSSDGTENQAEEIQSASTVLQNEPLAVKPIIKSDARATEYLSLNQDDGTRAEENSNTTTNDDSEKPLPDDKISLLSDAVSANIGFAGKIIYALATGVCGFIWLLSLLSQIFT